MWRDLAQKWPALRQFLYERVKTVSIALKSHTRLLMWRNRAGTVGDWFLDRFLPLFLSGYCVGYTCISLLGYPACVSGKSMQPAFNPKPIPSTWDFRAVSTPEDPFSSLSWDEYSCWNMEDNDPDVVMALWAQDWVWVNTWRARNFNFSQGDVVVYVSPKDPYDYIIKRVIALEGDIISSDRYERPYVRVPEGHLWLEGDNWGNSVDSNKYGPVSKGLVFGVATHIVWPPSRWQNLHLKVLPPNLHPERVISSARLRQSRSQAYRQGLVFYWRVLLNFLMN